MKKLIIIILLFVTHLIQAQIVSVQFDVKNATQGSKVNKAAPNVLIKYLDVYKFYEVGFVVESFPEIKYYSYGMLTNLNLIDYQDISIFFTDRGESINALLGIEVTRIGRYYGRYDEFFSVGGNAEFRYYSGKIGVTATYNYKYRTDQAYWNADSRWIGSVFFGLIYKTKK